VEVDLDRPQPKVKNKMAAKSLNFLARRLKFCVKVYLDHSQPKKWPPKKQNGHQINEIEHNSLNF